MNLNDRNERAYRQTSAPAGAIRQVNGQKSAEVIVAQRPPSWAGHQSVRVRTQTGGEGPNGTNASLPLCVCRHDESERRSAVTARHGVTGLT